MGHDLLILALTVVPLLLVGGGIYALIRHARVDMEPWYKVFGNAAKRSTRAE